MPVVLVVQLLNACHGNRQETYNIAVLFWLVCGTLLLCLVLTVVRDVDAVQERIIETLRTDQNQAFRGSTSNIAINGVSDRNESVNTAVATASPFHAEAPRPPLVMSTIEEPLLVDIDLSGTTNVTLILSSHG